MDDLISRKEAISSILLHTGYNSEEDAIRDVGNEEAVAVLAALDAVRWVPTVQTVPNKGTWVFDGFIGDTGLFKCSECGQGGGNMNKYKYCPFCGASMEGGNT